MVWRAQSQMLDAMMRLRQEVQEASGEESSQLHFASTDVIQFGFDRHHAGKLYLGPLCSL